MKTNDTTEQVFRYLREYVREHGYAPTFRDIMKAFGFRTPSVSAYHLAKLERAGCIRRTPGKARAIVILKKE